MTSPKDPMDGPKEYVRLTFLPAGARRRVTVWARVMRRTQKYVSYRQVKVDGDEWFGKLGDEVRVIMASPEEVEEQPARMNVRYEEFEIQRGTEGGARGR